MSTMAGRRWFFVAALMIFVETMVMLRVFRFELKGRWTSMPVMMSVMRGMLVWPTWSWRSASLSVVTLLFIKQTNKQTGKDILSYLLIEQTEENGDRERWELMGLHLWLQWFVKQEETTILFKIEGKE